MSRPKAQSEDPRQQVQVGESIGSRLRSFKAGFGRSRERDI